ncbi:hypothetical protein CKO42_04770 [Lamprobacter modestohalophilus]|uniref:Folate/biopterin family MFS transporter n=1 Tax=Lamprobacter modestohalophilus TaxID=1064514 RepID=A0A9X1B3N2_9GAMM|nr:hypothetical protein [Lamprobacter modestohalophilus]MBK1617777.1 hypothetical protein [Lamprobacter modestohalophilus]
MQRVSSNWFDRIVLDLGRQLRLSYLPPLMIYAAAGIQGLTAIVGTFFVKDYLGLSAEFLAALGFWAMLPWSLKMPLGHLVDLIWRWKAILVYLGAGLIAASLLMMLGLLSRPDAMASLMPIESWFVFSVLLAPLGYVVQDVVADAMTVEAVPTLDEQGQPIDAEQRRLMHTTMQTLGRVAIIGGGVAVALLNVWLFRDVGAMDQAAQLATYIDIFALALLIPVVSVSGVVLGSLLKRRELNRLRALGATEAAARLVQGGTEPTKPNPWILGGSLAFVLFTLAVGLGDVPNNKEIVFIGSLGIVSFLIWRLLRELTPEAGRVLLGTAIVIFVFRAVPSPGAGNTWWMIDDLGFDQQFISVLSLVGSSMALAAMFIFRRFMADHSIVTIIAFLTILSTLLSLPNLALYYGFHEWSAAHTAGIVDARFIALIDTALESPLGQVAMIPMLAWIANSAPAHLKATFFAVMASFTNLALSAGQLGTKYLNQLYAVTREVRVDGVVTVPADYSELGWLLWTVMALGLVLPFAAIIFVRLSRLRSA